MPTTPPGATPTRLSPDDAAFIQRARRLLEPLARYHHFRVEGLENVPASGPCLLVVHHSLATYDGFLIGLGIWDGSGRLPRGLGDDRIFQIPGLNRFAERCGLVPASPEAGERILREGEILGVAPGGMWESIRPHTLRRRSRWESRRGFARLALRTGAPMLFAACPAADEIYKVYPSRITDRLYDRFHIPLPLARGIGPTLLPRPVQLTAYLSPLLVPPAWDPAHEDDQIEALQGEARRRMAELLRR